jgi:hypothetical protein
VRAKILSNARDLVLPFYGVVLCHALALGFSEVLALRVATPSGPLATLTLLVLGFLALLLPLSLSLFALFRSLKHHPRSEAAVLVIGGYISVLLVFASLYFLFVFIGDFVDTRESNSYYHTEIQRMRQRPDRELRYRQVSERAFSGMSDRLWNGVEQRYGPLEDPRSGPPSPETISRQSSSGQPSFDFQAQNRLAVWFDCLHFSTVTITTLGYGDIIPKTWYAKLAADLEVLMGIVFVSLSLGRVLGGGENGA